MVLHMLDFLMCFVGMHVLTSLFLSVGDAENLSLLTSDTYGVPWADVQSTVEIILVMKLPAEQTRRLSWRLGLASVLMVAHGYSGEIQDNLLVRWSHGPALLRCETRRCRIRHDNVWYVCIPYGASSSGGSLGVTVVLFSGVACTSSEGVSSLRASLLLRMSREQCGAARRLILAKALGSRRLS